MYCIPSALVLLKRNNVRLCLFSLIFNRFNLLSSFLYLVQRVRKQQKCDELMRGSERGFVSRTCCQWVACVCNQTPFSNMLLLASRGGEMSSRLCEACDYSKWIIFKDLKILVIGLVNFQFHLNRENWGNPQTSNHQTCHHPLQA